MMTISLTLFVLDPNPRRKIFISICIRRDPFVHDVLASLAREGKAWLEKLIFL
jgi:hypothetical protein